MKKLSLAVLLICLLGMLISGCAEISAVQVEEAKAKQAASAAQQAKANAEAEAARAQAAQSQALAEQARANAEQAKAQTAQANAMKDVMISQQWTNLVGTLVLVLGLLLGVFMGMMGVFLASRSAGYMSNDGYLLPPPHRLRRGALPPPARIPEEYQIPREATTIRAWENPDVYNYRG